MNRKLPPTSVVVDHYLSGLTLKQIAAMYGASHVAVVWHLDRAGVPRRKNHAEHFRTPEMMAKAKANHVRGAASPMWKGLVVTDLIAAYSSGLPLQAIAVQFGVSKQTIYRLLRDAGVQLGTEGFSIRNFRPAADGHIAHSGWEVMVDNWLSQNAIAHTVHPSLIFGPGHRFAADFLVGSTYIEVWGVTRNVEYNKRRVDKLAAYAAHGMPVIEVWPRDLDRGDFSALHPLLTP